MTSSTGLRVPDWVLVDDDGDDVLLVDATYDGGYPLVIRERDVFLSLLDKLRAGTTQHPLDEAESTLLARLRDSGRIVDASLPDPDWAVPDGVGSPHLGNVVLEIEVGADGGVSRDGIRAVLDGLLGSARHLAGLVLRFRFPTDTRPDWGRLQGQLGEFVKDLEDACREGRGRGLAWVAEFPVSPVHVEGDAAELLLENVGRCRAVLRPRDPDGMPGEDELSACRRLADAGFECVLDLEPRCADDVRPVADAWLTDGRCGAVRLAPRPDPALDDAGLARSLEHARALAVTLADRLGSGLQRSQPWRSILVGSLVGWPKSVGWSKQQSRLYVAADGRWARSYRHAAHDLFEPLEALLPEPDAWRGRVDRDSRRDAGVDLPGVPECRSCGFAPLCDKFGSLEVDVARRLGASGRAAALAHYECDVRQDVLDRLVDSLRNDAPIWEERTLVQVQFDKEKGTVELGDRD